MPTQAGIGSVNLDFDVYQRDAAFTENKAPSPNMRLMIAALGLCGEAGEVGDHIKKIVGHGHPLTPELRLKILEEIGDVLWYCALLCTLLGASFAQVAWNNIQKLRKRYPNNTFSSERSLHRG